MSNSLRRIIVNTAKAPSAIGPYNQVENIAQASGIRGPFLFQRNAKIMTLNKAVIVDRTMYISGQIGMNPDTMELVSGGVQKQARQCLKNMGEILKAAGANFGNVVKATVLLKDINDFVAVNEVYKEFFVSPTEPARAAFQVAALPKGALVEIEAIAVVGAMHESKL